MGNSPQIWRLRNRLDAIVEQIVDGNHEYLSTDFLTEPPFLLLSRILVGSLLVSIQSGETTAGWTVRYKRILAPRFHALIDSAAINARSANANDVIHELASLGLTGLVVDRDPLSSDDRTDIPSRKLAFALPTWAGIDQCPVIIRCDEQIVHSAMATISILLPAKNRGAHMSRLQEKLMEFDNRQFSNIDMYVEDLARSLVVEQPATLARVVVNAGIKHVIVSEVAERASSLPLEYKVALEVSIDGTIRSLERELTIGIMTACPCTLKFSQLKGMRQLGLVSGEYLIPTFTHSQPGKLRVSVSSNGDLPTLSAMIAACGTAAHLREAVLKRQDEHALVERFHRRPQFAEDVVRSAALHVAARCADVVQVKVDASLDESIHPHRAVARIDATAAAILGARK